MWEIVWHDPNYSCIGCSRNIVCLYSLNFLNFPFGSETLATFSLDGEMIHFKNYMGNCFGFKIQKDAVAHFLSLAAIADIAEPALVAALDQEGNF